MFFIDKPFSRIERFVILGLSAALAAFTMACIFWPPYDQSKLLRAVPANASVIGFHRNLGPRLENMATNAFFKSFFNEEAVSQIHKRRNLLRMLSARMTIMAYVPDFNQTSCPAVLVSSWIGAWSPLLRWALWVRAPADVMPLGEHNGHRLWTYKKPAPCFGAVNYFSFAIDEGVFIGCLSRDRDGIVGLLANIDGRRNSILNAPGRSRPQNLFDEKTAVADQVRIRFDLPPAAQNKSFFALCALDDLSNNSLSATIRFEPDIILNDYAGRDRSLAEIGRMYAGVSSIIAFFPSDMVAGGLDGLLNPEWSRAIMPLLVPSSGTNNACLLTVLTGAYGGQFGREPFRIAVPTVMLAASGARPAQTKAAVLELLDLINLKHRLGLILNSALPPAGQCQLVTIESTSGAPLDSLPVDDQPAFAFLNGWFLLASNGGALRKLLLDFQSRPVTVHGGINRCLEQAAGRQASAFVGIDPGEGGKALRFAMTAAIMMLDSDKQDARREGTIKIIKGARAWLESISNMKKCAAWLESEGGHAVVHLEINSNN